MPTAKILIAVRDEAISMVEAALEGYELIVPRDMAQSKKLLLETVIDLFVIGVLFDDSSAIDLITTVRLDSKQGNTPILVVRLMPSLYADMLRNMMRILKELGTVSDYLELDLADLEVKERIRAAIEQYLPADKQVLQVGACDQ